MGFNTLLVFVLKPDRRKNQQNADVKIGKSIYILIKYVTTFVPKKFIIPKTMVF